MPSPGARMGRGGHQEGRAGDRQDRETAWNQRVPHHPIIHQDPFTISILFPNLFANSSLSAQTSRILT